MINDKNNGNKIPNVPNLRFKEFTNLWKQISFENLAFYKKGPFGSALTKDIFVPKSEDTIKVYEQQNAIYKDWKLSRYYITNEYYKKMKSFTVYCGDIIVSCAGTIGELYVIPNDAEIGIINQALMIIRTSEIVNQKFYIYLFNIMIKSFSEKYGNGSAIHNIPPFNDLKKHLVFIPSINEQIKIATFLTKIDERIESQSKIIEDLILQINYIKYKLFQKYINDHPNSKKYKFDDMFISYKKLNNSNLQQYTIGKNGIKTISNIPIYSTNSHIVFEPNSLILGIGIEEIGVSTNITGCCSPIYKTYKINNSIINTLFLSFFASMYFFMLKNYVTQKSTRRNFEFDYKSLTNITFTLPNIEIQKNDARIIEKFYIKLNKEKDILSLYKKQKAYLLQNMFI